MKLVRRAATLATAGTLLYLLASYAASRVLARRLLSPTGLGPTPDRQDALLTRLRRIAPTVVEFRHEGSPRLPVALSSVFATPGDPPHRPTLLFLHGKGGNAGEWEPDAVRALELGYNVLVPDLRGHGKSGGTAFTLGFLERDDLALGVEAAAARFGVDPNRLGIHSCSAGSAVALEFAADRPGVRGIWLESPFAEPRQMARHYLSLATGVPAPLLGLASRWAVRRAIAGLRRELRGPETGAVAAGLLDPLRAVARVAAPIALVHGGEDRLVPPHFTERLAAALPAGSEVWTAVGAGHCHHDNEAEKVLREEYERRWTEFFTRHLPLEDL